MRLKFIQEIIDFCRFKYLIKNLNVNSVALKMLLNIIDIFMYGNHKIKVSFLKFLGANINNDVGIGVNCDIYNLKNLEIKKSAYIGDNVVFRCWNKIFIDEYAFTGPNCKFFAGSHKTDNYENMTENQDIKIGKGCWLGGNCTILGGANVGDGCIIAAGSVVLPGKYPSYKIMAGVPAKIKKDRQVATVIKQPCEYNIGELNGENINNNACV